MPRPSPAEFLRLAAHHAETLEEIARLSSDGGSEVTGVAEAVVLDLIARNGRRMNASNPQAPFGVAPRPILGRLLSVGILQPVPGRDGAYELPVPLGTLLRQLLAAHQLTGLKVIDGFRAELESSRDALDAARAKADGAAAAQALRAFRRVVEDLTYRANESREALVLEASKIKQHSATDHPLPLLVKFERVRTLWDDFVIPLGLMIELGGPMDRTLDNCRASLLEAEVAFAHDGPLLAWLGASMGRLQFLRQKLAAAHKEGWRELEPLYRQLHRDSRMAAGAGMVLQAVYERRRGAFSGIPAYFTWRSDGLLSDQGLEMVAAQYHGFTAEEPQPLFIGATEDPPSITLASKSALAEQLSESSQLPVLDFLAWLLEREPKAPVQRVLTAYGWAVRGELGPMHMDDQRRHYSIEDGRLSLEAAVVSVRPHTMETA